MAKQKNSHHSAEDFQSTKKVYPNQGGFSGFVEQVHSINALYMITGFCQLCLGLVVGFIAVIGMIQPFWLSVTLTVLGSISITTGVYYCYSAISHFNSDNLLRDAMRRAVEDQN